SGSITGIRISGGAGTVTNSSTISGSSTGLYLANSGYIGNTGGRITGSGTGIKIAGTAGTVVNTARISGATGVAFSNAPNSTLVNSGTIIGAGGTAFDFGTGTGETLVIHAGAVFDGAIAHFAISDTIDLADIGAGGHIT